ncbi:MAG: xanthine dehydrogenase family protein molybdopterin-binding subunit, partial [Acidobacteriia bacterium]|nr:xanthine dehydrogenase family protein molybdopterin-binding subunit [Terriglobia bacterium]
IGDPVSRKDGVLKAIGAATYAADHQIPKLAYAAVVQSTIAKGTILEIDDRAAMHMPGVLAVITYKNAPRLQPPGDYSSGGEYSEHHHPLQDPTIYYNGQYVAVVVASTWEEARASAASVGVRYGAETPAVSLESDNASFITPEMFYGRNKLQIERGDFEAAMGSARIRMAATYSTPLMHNNPLEPHATIAAWDQNHLTVYETTQWLLGMQSVLSKSFGIPAANVHVISPFVGGGFGCKGFVWPHSVLAAMAARHVRRPVKLALRRQELFSAVGHRGRTRQQIALGCETSGKLLALKHATLTETSPFGVHMEPCGLVSAVLYACPNVKISHRVARLNLGAPAPMRAPGEAPGSFALESAMDELAFQIGMDPVDLRIRNHADRDPEKDQDWTSKHVIESYRRGAELFGWSRRSAQPASMRKGKLLVGYGMATAAYPANRRPGSASVRMLADATVIVESATQDLGTGTYTILAEIAADELGISLENVRTRIGDSSLPKAGVSGGSSTSASVGPAVKAAARAVREKAIKTAIGDPRSPLSGLMPEKISAGGGYLMSENRGLRDSYSDVIRRSGQSALEAKGQITEDDVKALRNSAHSFGAHFVEVNVDSDLGMVRVARVVTVMDVGRVLNRLTATSQIRGAVIWGLSMALMEESVIDGRQGRMVMRNLSDYLIPVNADVPPIEVEFLNYPDYAFNTLGVRGIGEIGITGTAAAVANAVFHATGRRVRDLPITVEKVLAAS